MKEEQVTAKLQINIGKHSIDSLQKTAILGTSHNTEILETEP
jgi:hypothetical protein